MTDQPGGHEFGRWTPGTFVWSWIYGFLLLGMNPQALVYSPNRKIGEAVSAVALKRGMAPMLESGVRATLELLESKKFPAVILDFSGESAASELLHTCRNSRSNSSAMVIALVGQESIDSARGSNLWVKLSPDLRELSAALRSMEGIILREFQRYRRAPISSSVVLDNDEHSLQLQTVNISQGGMCVSGEIPGWNREHFVHFLDPDRGIRFETKSVVVWKANGKSGIQFRFASESGRAALAHWLQAAQQ